MKLTFNLNKMLQQMREAMAEWGVYQPTKSWWTLQELINGDPEWEAMQNGDLEKGILPNKGMENALSEIHHFYLKRKLFFRARYGVSDEEANKFFQVWVGYDPMRGVHMMSIGPYYAEAEAWSVTKALCEERGVKWVPTTDQLKELAETIKLPDPMPKTTDKDYKEKMKPVVLRNNILSVRSDLLNKFSFFTRRFGKADEDDVNKAINTQLKNVLKNFGTMLSPDDLTFEVKGFPKNLVGVGLLEDKNTPKETKATKLTPDGIKSIVTKKPILGTGSNISVNAQGLNKILKDIAAKGNWQDLYDQAVQEIVSEFNSKGKKDPNFKPITVEEISNSRNIVMSVVSKLRDIKQQLKKEGNPKAEFLNIPEFTPKTLPNTRQGQQQNSTFRISTVSVNIFEYKMDILNAINKLGTDDAQKVADYLNSTRVNYKTKAQAVLTADIVQQWIDQLRTEGQTIKKGKVVKQKSWSEILTNTQEQWDEIMKNETYKDVGFENLASAYRVATLSFMGSPTEFIDKKTRAKINLVDPPNFFERPEMEIESTTKQLTNLRKARAKKGSEEDLRKSLKAEIEKQIGKKELNQPPSEVKPDESELQVPTPVKGGETPETTPEGTPDFDITDMTHNMPQGKTPTGVEPTVPATPATQPVDQTQTPEEVTPGTPETPAEAPKQKIKPKKLNLKKLLGGTLSSLIAMARDLDSQGKEEAAEEIHQIIRKYQSKI